VTAAHDSRSGQPEIGSPTAPTAHPPSDRTKRAIDVASSALALVALGPVMVGIALAIRLTMGTPVLFRQVRPGLRGAPFELVKFRTMSGDVGPDGVPRPDEMRITRLGRLLRRLSVDELPELLNVLKGDMSLVGPRPLLLEYLPRYTSEQARRHEVRPGVTGWAQVHGRRRVPMAERFALDVWYVDHRSTRLDIRILLLTIQRVLGGSGVEPPAITEPDPFHAQPLEEGPAARREVP
jgi:sugar transferase EpsL